MEKIYRRIGEYEKEILEMREKGLTTREIGNQLGFSREQVKGFIKRRNRKIRMEEVGQITYKKNRSGKNNEEIPPSIQRLDKLAQMKYVMESKDKYIKQLEMENELMRDFLSLTERK